MSAHPIKRATGVLRRIGQITFASSSRSFSFPPDQIWSDVHTYFKSTRNCLQAYETPPCTDPDLVVRHQIWEYVRRAKVLRQIHSNKGSRSEKWSRRYMLATIVVATIVTFIGFFGIDEILSLISTMSPLPSLAIVDFSYNLLVLLILIISLVGLIFRFEERRVQHYHSVEMLTEFIRDCEDAIELSQQGARPLALHDLEIVRTRYKGILKFLPPNTDEEYLRAKRDAVHKQGSRRHEIHDQPLDQKVSRRDTLENSLSKILLSDPTRVALLETVRSTLGEEAWMAGGQIRNAVWDALHEYPIATQRADNDVDVIYFDREDTSTQAELIKQALLCAQSPNVRWSVKNEARMHLLSGDTPYKTLEDAVSHFPETASAVAVRTGTAGGLHVIAPYGLQDLFSLVLRPTPHVRKSRYRERIHEKQWQQTWSGLTLLEKPLGRTSRLGAWITSRVKSA